MKKRNLKPCPLCGNTAFIVTLPANKDKYYIKCGHLACPICTFCASTKKELDQLVKDWNTRTEE